MYGVAVYAVASVWEVSFPFGFIAKKCCYKPHMVVSIIEDNTASSETSEQDCSSAIKDG